MGFRGEVRSVEEGKGRGGWVRGGGSRFVGGDGLRGFFDVEVEG